MPAAPDQRDTRLHLIRTLLERRRIGTQGELARLLTKRGHVVTQSSVSRDLRELGAAKVDGAYRISDFSPDPSDEVQRTVFALVLDTAPAGDHLLVVRTPPGAAAIVSAAIDELDLNDVVGTLAGDDTVFVATAGRSPQQRVVQALDALSQGGTP